MRAASVMSATRLGEGVTYRVGVVRRVVAVAGSHVSLEDAVDHERAMQNPLLLVRQGVDLLERQGRLMPGVIRRTERARYRSDAF